MSVLVNKPAPDFSATAVMEDGSTKTVSLADYKGQYVAIFFYPKDFTFVWPSELIAIDHRIDEFNKRGIQVLGVSIDDAETHANWRNTAINEGGIGPVRYPLLCDENRNMTNAYDVLHEETTFSMRGTFLIDKEGMVQSQSVNNLPLGRNLDEVIRLFDAIDFLETSDGLVCPAGWSPGKAGMEPTAEGVASYLSDNANSL